MKNLIYQKVGWHTVPPYWMKSAYFDYRYNSAIYVIFPLNYLVQVAWFLNLAWCKFKNKPSWIDKKAMEYASYMSKERYSENYGGLEKAMSDNLKQDSGIQGECPAMEDYSLEGFDGTYHLDESNWGSIAINNDDIPLYNRIIDVTPNYTIRFFNKDQKEVGNFDFNGDKLKFEGDVEESAEVFINFLLDCFHKRIDEIKEATYDQGYFHKKNEE